jgi:hypothetical protein
MSARNDRIAFDPDNVGYLVSYTGLSAFGSAKEPDGYTVARNLRAIKKGVPDLMNSIAGDPLPIQFKSLDFLGKKNYKYVQFTCDLPEHRALTKKELAALYEELKPEVERIFSLQEQVEEILPMFVQR